MFIISGLKKPKSDTQDGIALTNALSRRTEYQISTCSNPPVTQGRSKYLFSSS